MDLTELSSILNEQPTKTDLLVSFIINTIIILLTFSLKAIAIRTLAKKCGYGKLYLAWIPFFNFILLGKIVGKTVLWGVRLKNLGLLVSILYLISYVMLTLLNLGYYIRNFEIVFNFKVEFASQFVKDWMSGTGVLFTVINILHTILSLVEIFTKASLIYCIFRLYAPERAFIYMIVSILVDPLLGPILFMIRNRNKINYIYVRPSVYNNPYGNPYNNPYSNGGYGQNNNAKNAESVEDDPFPEFSNKTSGVDSTSNNTNDDDLFN